MELELYGNHGDAVSFETKERSVTTTDASRRHNYFIADWRVAVWKLADTLKWQQAPENCSFVFHTAFKAQLC